MMTSISALRKELLRRQAKAFCDAFLLATAPEQVLSQFFVRDSPRITEHGPSWAQERLPFLGRTFEGIDECLKYFKLLSETLEFHPGPDTFPPAEGFVVDESAQVAGPSAYGSASGVVSVVAKAEFASIRTGKKWREDFIYRLSGFDDQGRIGHWEIWADPLSAWDAVGSD